MTNRRIEYVPLDEVEPATRNPRRHGIDGIRASIGRFGFATPALRDERTGRLVAGHGRTLALAAMKADGEDPPAGIRLDGDRWLVPVICGWESRSDAEADAYLVADNRHTELAGWDDAGLHALLASIGEVDPDLVAIAGYTDDDLSALLESGPKVTELPPALDDPDAVPAVPVDPVTRPGDIWRLGPHTIICGDCRDFETVAKLLGDTRVNVAFTSPPYASQRKYDESSGFKPIRPDEYVDWFEDIQANVRAVLAEDGSWFVNIKENSDDGQRVLYVKDLVVAHVRRWGWLWVEELCWLRAGMPGSPESMRRFKNGFEPVFQFASIPGWKFRPDAVMHESDSVISYADQKQAGKKIGASGQGGLGGVSSTVGHKAGMAYPSNVLDIKSNADAVGHAAAFPVALPAWFIRAYSDPGDTVFDPFMGSGTTLIAAHQEQRVAYGSEISPAYCDVICARFQKATGVKPVLAATGKPHDFTTAD